MQEQQAAGCFPPRFTYHAFGTDESIQGYEGLKICVYFNAYDFNAYVDVQYKEKESRYCSSLIHLFQLGERAKE